MKTYNFAPGPTPISPEIAAAMSKPILTHRSSEFSALLAEITDGLKYVFQTENEVLTLTASGSGALESSVVNVLSPGDKALTIVSGKFGGRWVELCETYGIDVVVHEVPWGEAVDPERIAEILKAEGDFSALLATHSETSTGVLHDIETLGAIAGAADVLFLVDAVSGLCANELRTDEWGVDIAVTGSQKGLMLPPGLAFVSISDKAWAASRASNNPSFYLSFERARSSLEKGLTPYTPAVTLIMGLAEVLKQIRSMGLEAVFDHHAHMAAATRAAITAMNLKLFARSPSNVLTSVMVPDSIDGNSLLRHIKTSYGVTIANGMEQYKGTVMRISHLGWAVNAFDMMIAISALERGLAFFGHEFEMGAGVAAMQRFLYQAETVSAVSAG